jgi:hypothetical protein
MELFDRLRDEDVGAADSDSWVSTPPAWLRSHCATAGDQPYTISGVAGVLGNLRLAARLRRVGAIEASEDVRAGGRATDGRCGAPPGSATRAGRSVRCFIVRGADHAVRLSSVRPKTRALNRCRVPATYDARTKEDVMADQEEGAWVQLATRIPKTLHRELKLHCVTADVTVMAFVVDAVRERLARTAGKKRAGRATH